jgi:predicted oxidoreductase
LVEDGGGSVAECSGDLHLRISGVLAEAGGIDGEGDGGRSRSTVRVMEVGATSLSVRPMEVDATVKPSAAPATSMVSSPSARLSSFTEMASGPVPSTAPAGTVTVTSPTV